MPIINTVITQGGITPTGTKYITNNGITDVSGYANADVQVPTTAPTYYIEKGVDSTGTLVNKGYSIINTNGVVSIGPDVLSGAYKENTYISGEVDFSTIQQINIRGCYSTFNSCSHITSVDLSSLTQILQNGCENMFYGCNNLTSVDLSSLTTIENDDSCRQMFYSAGANDFTIDLSSLTTIGGAYSCHWMFYWSKLSSISLPSLITINGSNSCYGMFAGCIRLTSIDMSNLKTISGGQACYNMFNYCTSLTSIDLSGLETISGDSACSNMFSSCASLQSIDLSSLMNISGNNALTSMFSGCNSLTTVVMNPNCPVLVRNPIPIFDGKPLTTFLYENMEYQSYNDRGGLCSRNQFRSANFKRFEMCNATFTSVLSTNTNLEEVKFPVLTRWNGNGAAAYLLYGCTNSNLTDVYFPMLRDMRNTVPFTGTSFPSQVTIHFRKDQQALIESSSYYSVAFGGSSVVFDLIGNITVNGIDYIYEAKENETGYKAWHKKNATMTLSNGKTYVFAQNYISRNTSPVNSGPVIYGWNDGQGTGASNYIFTDTLKPQVGDFIYTAYDSAKSTTISITTIDDEWVYTIDSSIEPQVGDNVYSDTQGTVLGTISAIA